MGKKANKSPNKGGTKGGARASASLTEEELEKAKVSLRANLKAESWETLEVGKDFKKNDKLEFISDDKLIVGCDIGGEKHYVRAINSRGIELSKEAFSFSNTAEDYEALLDWMLTLAVNHGMKQIVLGLEPTGHYWFNITSWLGSRGITVVQVNPYAVKQTKEIEDNSQVKSDRKDPKVIANLVKDGNYGMPYLPEGDFMSLREFSTLRDQVVGSETQAKNRLHRDLAIVFPEYKSVFGNLDGPFALELLKKAPVPPDMVLLGVDGIQEVWKKAKLKGVGYKKASKIVELAEKTVGLHSGLDGYRVSIVTHVEEIESREDKLEEIDACISELLGKCQNAKNIQAIPGIGEKTAAGIVTEIGDIRRFSSPKEIQKLAGLAPVSDSSGKHQGETKISRRGRKRLRYWLYMAAVHCIVYNNECKELYNYYLTRPQNPLKKKQAQIAVACKLLRIMYAILAKGVLYDPHRVLGDIVRPEPAAAV